MIPDKKDIRWKQVATGQKDINYKNVALGMMSSRHKREYLKDQSEENIMKLTEETYNFFVKFENILTDDIEELFK